MADYKLEKEFADQWLTALRSGEYAQCSDTLYDGEGYCCLGVAGKILGMSDKELENEPTLVSVYSPEAHSVPDTIADGKLVDMLVTMNDNEGKNFKEIADWIEQNVEIYEGETNKL